MYKLLVVDDEYAPRNTLCSCFPWNQVGFEIIAQVDDGKAALDYVLKESVDVVLCDIKMPVMSGIEFASELHTRKNKTVIVFLSGYRDFEYAQQALTFGVRHYILKPARYEELMSIFSALKQELDERRGLAEPASLPMGAIKNPDSHGFQDKLISTVKKYMEDNYLTVTLEDVAKVIHLNPSYLSQIFKQKTGSNFSDYLIEVKMKKAAELLQDPSLKTYDVSERVGYTNAKNFTRAFKYYFGMTPREYRQTTFGFVNSEE